jgi:chloramphenicol 3-O-phosphotransferase
MFMAARRAIGNRSFYYNVTYEAIAFVSCNWKARRLSVSHLSGSGSFHADIATCNAEALAHYCDSVHTVKVESFMFVGCCMSLEHLTGISRLNAEAQTGLHHAISKEVEHSEGYELVHLDWGRAAMKPHA